MERTAAAEFLGVSVSTLDRFASQGRLTRGRARRKTRPVTIFDEVELARLKAEIAQSGKALRASLPEPPKAQDAVGFRLDPYYVNRLKEEGAANGMSAGEYARKLVIQGLETSRPELPATDSAKAARELAALKPILLDAIKSQEPGMKKRTEGLQKEIVAEVASVREALAQAFFALLVMKMDTSEEQAREFVNETIRRKRLS